MCDLQLVCLLCCLQELSDPKLRTCRAWLIPDKASHFAGLAEHCVRGR